MIKYTSNNQILLEEFMQPFSGKLNKENRWVKLGETLPWDEMVSIYCNKMSKDMGRTAVNPRIAIGAIIIKHLKRLTDEETVEEICENPYLQYFLGYTEYSFNPPFTPSLFVSFRRRLGEAQFEAFSNRLVSYVPKAEEKKKRNASSKSKDSDNSPTPGKRTDVSNHGHLIVDATVSPSDIKYPTDLDLLSDSRQKSELLIDLLYLPESGRVKPRTYRKVAQVKYLSAAKRKQKTKKLLRKAIGQQLRYLCRNLKTIEKLLDEKGTNPFPLAYKYQRLYWVIQEVYRQQKQMYDAKSHKTEHRIVSISQPHVRPIVRGKTGSDVEFGAKLSVSLVDGFSYLHRISWDAYNESVDLKPQIETYQAQFGFYPEWVSADKIYGTRDNRSYMKAKGIKFSGVPLGRFKSLTTEHKAERKERKHRNAQRSRVEGKFGEGKRKYDLGLVKAKRSDTSESWIGAVFFVMNIAHFLRVIFLSFLKISLARIKIFKTMLLNQYHVLRQPIILSAHLTF